MSKIVELILNKARDLEAKASDQEWDMVKQAAISKLVSNGVSTEDADALLEKLAEEASPNRGLELKLRTEYSHMSDILTKLASHITDLEVKLSDKDAEVTKLTKQASSNKTIDRLKDVFSESDLEKLAELDPSVLEKVAKTLDKRDLPSYGGPSDQMRSDLDPIQQFCMS